MPTEEYKVNPSSSAPWDRIFTLHADHETTPPTHRASGPVLPVPTRLPVIIAARIASCGARPTVVQQPRLKMRSEEIGSVDRIPEYIAKAKDKNDPVPSDGLRSPGLQENHDPRATVMRETCQ